VERYVERLAWLLEGLGSAGAPIVGALLFLAFGVTAARLLGLRGTLLTVVVALPVGIALLALTSEALGLLGVQWSLVLDGITALVVAGVVALVRRSLAQSDASSLADREPGRLRWAGAISGALLGVGAWLAGIGDFRLPPQANDDIWHGYLVERLTQMPSITASSVAPAFADSAQPVWHYPYGIHLTQALVREVTAFSVPELLNGAWLVYVGVLLPLGLVALAWRLWPDRPWVAFWAGVMSSAVTVFPFLTNGVFPYTVALAMIPGFLALLLTHLRQPGVPGYIVAVSAVGIFVTHPLAAVVAAALAAPLIVEEALRRWPDPALAGMARRLAVVAALTAIGSLPWLLNSKPTEVLPPTANVDGLLPAVTMFLTMGSPWTPPQYPLATLVAVGVVAAIVTRRGPGLAVGLLLFGALFVCDIAAIPATATITGIFLGWYRLLAVVGLLLPMFAGLGAASIVTASRRALAHLAPAWSPRGVAAVALAVGVVAGSTTLYGATRGLSIVRTAWHASGLVSSEDVHLFGELAEQLSPTDRVLNSPRDGSTWMFALFQAMPVIPYATPASLEWSRVFSGGGGPPDRAAVCRRLEESGVTYAIVKRVTGEVGDFDIAAFVDRNPTLFTQITGSDSAAIYRVDRAALDRCAAT
jgi:hypothetical protein